MQFNFSLEKADVLYLFPCTFKPQRVKKKSYFSLFLQMEESTLLDRCSDSQTHMCECAYVCVCARVGAIYARDHLNVC